jgi:hypothetical protein
MLLSPKTGMAKKAAGILTEACGTGVSHRRRLYLSLFQN